MKRFLVGATAATVLVLGVQTGASAHVTEPTTRLVCENTTPKTVVEFTNDFTVPLTVTVGDIELVVPAVTESGLGKGSTTLPYEKGKHSYTAVWSDGFYAEGSFEVPTLIDGCLSKELLPVPPLPRVVPTTPPTTPSTTPPADSATVTSVPVDIIEQVEAKSTTECDENADATTCLAHTGNAHTVPMIEVGSTLVFLGVWALLYERKRRALI